MYKIKNKFINGISLIEMLISLTLGILVLSCLIAIFTATEKNHKKLIALNTLQENLRIVTQILRSEIQYAGYIGCAKLNDEFMMVNHTSYLIDKNKIITTNQDVNTHSDSITVMHADVMHSNLLRHYGEILEVTASPVFAKGDTLIISDYQHAEIFQVKNSSLKNGIQKITAETQLVYHYDKSAEISRFMRNTYFINQGLYVEDIHQNKTKLIDDISDMKIKINKSTNIIGVEIEMMISKTKHIIYSALRQV